MCIDHGGLGSVDPEQLIQTVREQLGAVLTTDCGSKESEPSEASIGNEGAVCRCYSGELVWKYRQSAGKQCRGPKVDNSQGQC